MVLPFVKALLVLFMQDDVQFLCQTLYYVCDFMKSPFCFEHFPVYKRKKCYYVLNLDIKVGWEPVECFASFISYGEHEISLTLL
jgi:hypothetical protein